MVNDFLREQIPVNWDISAFENFVVDALDADRKGGTHSMLPTPFSETRSMDVVYEDQHWRQIMNGEEPDARVRIGPSPTGGFFSLIPYPDRVPIGQSFAPFAAKAFDFADQTFGTHIGCLECPKAVR